MGREFGKWLSRQRRQVDELTQLALARASGIDDSKIVNIENGRSVKLTREECRRLDQQLFPGATKERTFPRMLEEKLSRLSEDERSYLEEQRREETEDLQRRLFQSGNLTVGEGMLLRLSRTLSNELPANRQKILDVLRKAQAHGAEADGPMHAAFEEALLRAEDGTDFPRLLSRFLEQADEVAKQSDYIGGIASLLTRWMKLPPSIRRASIAHWDQFNSQVLEALAMKPPPVRAPDDASTDTK